MGILWFGEEEVHTKLLNIIDLAGSANAESMANALIWSLCTDNKLNIKDLIYSCTDSTNSMSGLGDLGGCLEQVRRSFPDLEELLPRAPCSLHALHLGVANTKSILYYGELPSMNERDQLHLWNLFWIAYKLFGKDDVRMYGWQVHTHTISMYMYIHTYICRRLILCN